MRVFVVTCVLAMLLCGSAEARPRTFSTDYFRIEVDGHGYVVGMWNRADGGRNFSPADRPSPLLALYDETLKRYYYPPACRVRAWPLPSGVLQRVGRYGADRGEAALH